MPASDCRPLAILEVTFQCAVCDEDKPVCQAVRIPHGATAYDPHADVCRACYEDGVADGIIDAMTGDFVVD